MDTMMTRSEVAAFLRCSQRTISRAAASGMIPCVRIGPRTLRFRRSDIEALGTPKRHKSHLAAYHATGGEE